MHARGGARQPWQAQPQRARALADLVAAFARRHAAVFAAMKEEFHVVRAGHLEPVLDRENAARPVE